MQLEKCALKFLNIRVNPIAYETAFASGEGPTKAMSGADKVDCTFELNLRTHAREPKYWVSYVIRLRWDKAANPPFDVLEAGIDGVFAFPKDTPKEEIRKYVPVLCLASLHGTLRGIIAGATGLMPGGPFILPHVNMNKVVRDVAETEAAGEKRLSHGKACPRRGNPPRKRAAVRKRTVTGRSAVTIKNPSRKKGPTPTRRK